MSKRITFVAKKEMAENLENEAERLKLNKSEIIRRALANHLFEGETA